MWWMPTATLLPGPDAPLGEWMTVVAAKSVVRETGGVISAVRQRAAEFARDSLWGEEFDLLDKGRFRVLSAWLLEYEPGDFVALHTDRPDSTLTGLVGVDALQDPLIVCPELADLPAEELRLLAERAPHPSGIEVVLRRDAMLLLEGARVPHHRPPVSEACRVLSLSFARPI